MDFWEATPLIRTLLTGPKGDQIRGRPLYRCSYKAVCFLFAVMWPWMTSSSTAGGYQPVGMPHPPPPQSAHYVTSQPSMQPPPMAGYPAVTHGEYPHTGTRMGLRGYHSLAGMGTGPTTMLHSIPPPQPDGTAGTTGSMPHPQGGVVYSHQLPPPPSGGEMVHHVTAGGTQTSSLSSLHGTPNQEGGPLNQPQPILSPHGGGRSFHQSPPPVIAPPQPAPPPPQGSSPFSMDFILGGDRAPPEAEGGMAGAVVPTYGGGMTQQETGELFKSSGLLSGLNKRA